MEFTGQFIWIHITLWNLNTKKKKTFSTWIAPELDQIICSTCVNKPKEKLHDNDIIGQIVKKLTLIHYTLLVKCL